MPRRLLPPPPPCPGVAARGLAHKPQTVGTIRMVYSYDRGMPVVGWGGWGSVGTLVPPKNRPSHSPVRRGPHQTRNGETEQSRSAKKKNKD